MMTWRVLQYIRHSFHQRHRKGHGIHSPYIFEFVNGVLFNGRGKQVPMQVHRVHASMRKDCTLIPVEGPAGFGAGSKFGPRSDTLSISSFVKKSSVSRKYGALLYRISDWFAPEVIVELGGGLGISAMYLAAGSPGARMMSVEGRKMRAVIAKQVLHRSKLNHVEIIEGDIERILPDLLPRISARLLAFLDGNHRYRPTIGYVRNLMDAAGDEAVIILDDIYWSREMHEAWKELLNWPEVRVSIDLFHMGVLLLRRDLAKERLKIKF